jgi:uncharacterized membrane protein YdfJ with MMPL/SSD domain
MARLLHRIGAFGANHRLAVTLVWLLAVVLAVGAVTVFGAKTNNELTLPGTDSQAAFDILADRFPPQQNGTSPFVFATDDGTLLDERAKAAIDATYKRMESAEHVHSVTNPLSKDGRAAGLLSDEETIAFMPVLLDIDSGFITVSLAEKVLEATEPARDAGLQVAVGGPIGSELSEPDTSVSERVGNIAAMVILAIVFGSLIAMGLPIITAAVGLAVATSLIGLLGHLIAVPTVAPTLAVMIGLGVGIDYALFLVTKHKEQLADGEEMRASIADAVASSGSAIVFAGSTVVIALVSLSVAGIPLVTTLGVASAIAVLAAVVTSITLMPAILSWVGNGVNRLRLPRFMQLKKRPAGATRWDAWARGVARHPWWAIALAALILAPLIVPLFDLQLGQEDVGVTPTSTTERQAYDLMTEGFGVGYNGPLLIAMTLDPPARASEGYTRKYDEATALQQELEREQRRLDRKQEQLEARQDELEAEQASLERQGAALERRTANLERRAADLEREQAALLSQEARLRAQAERLADRAEPIVAHLAFILAREALVRELIEQTTDPDKLERLRRRLARLEEKEARTRARLQPLVDEGRTLLTEAERLRAEGEALERQADALRATSAELEREGADLQRQADALERQGDALQAQADDLEAQAAEAKDQKRRALKLQRELTDILTTAGGDDRGTDHRIVGVQDALLDTPGVVGLFPPQINDAGDAVVLSAVPERAPSAPATVELVERLRDPVLPDATEGEGVVTHVGGSTASNVDLATKISQRLPIVIATVVILSFLLLMVAFHSLTVPLQAAVTNLLSVAAALGVLTAVFQWGWGLSLIGLDAPRGTVPIASYVPLMMFAVLFGLSMDYEVFLVSRIAQQHGSGKSAREAVPAGLGASARVISAAALIMICVFAAFILTGDPTVKQFGVGLSVAVALAGTMVVLLAPALLVLFGESVFRLPGRLDRLVPRIDIEGGVAEEPVPGREVDAGPDGDSADRGGG